MQWVDAHDVIETGFYWLDDPADDKMTEATIAHIRRDGTMLTIGAIPIVSTMFDTCTFYGPITIPLPNRAKRRKK